ncbi:hypothetical protein BDW22DRAFT_1108559 [Trametopsis cervina]|nr:hypothetical protein BDW22DRAFT_1108559 [Trametopsis cervina]
MERPHCSTSSGRGEGRSRLSVRLEWNSNSKNDGGWRTCTWIGCTGTTSYKNPAGKLISVFASHSSPHIPSSVCVCLAGHHCHCSHPAHLVRQRHVSWVQGMDVIAAVPCVHETWPDLPIEIRIHILYCTSFLTLPWPSPSSAQPSSANLADANVLSIPAQRSPKIQQQRTAHRSASPSHITSFPTLNQN